MSVEALVGLATVAIAVLLSIAVCIWLEWMLKE